MTSLNVTLIILLLGGTMAQWLALSPHSKNRPSWLGHWGVCGWDRTFLCRVCMFSSGPRRFGFLPQSKDMQHNRLTDDSKLPVGVNMSVSGCLSLCVSPEMNWRLVQGVPRLSPRVGWDRLQPPATLMDKRLQKMNE